jgi:hypothetical protein
MLSKKDIIEIHGKIMTDLLVMIHKSEKIAPLSNIKIILYNGMNMLNHIFNMNIIYDTPRDILFHNCQKGSFCYLEYIEQAVDKQIVQNLDFTTIYSFVYRQTINFLNTSNTIKNPTICNLLNLLQKNLEVLIWMNMEVSMETLISLCDCYLINFAKLFYKLNNNIDIYYTLLRSGLTNLAKTSNNEQYYFVFLDAFYTNIYKLKTKNLLPTPSQLNHAVMLSLIQDVSIAEEKDVKKLVKEFFTIEQ